MHGSLSEIMASFDIKSEIGKHQCAMCCARLFLNTELRFGHIDIKNDVIMEGEPLSERSFQPNCGSIPYKHSFE